jgi:ATP/maltotriose-dependent transcriptional regulator MalT
LFRLIAANLHACARAIREPSEENLTALRSAIEAYHQTGSHLSDAFYFSHLAEASIAAGDVLGADAALREAFASVEQSGERSFLAGLYRVDGQVSLKRPERDERGRKPHSSRRSTLPAARRPACSNCAPPPTLPGYGARQVRQTILARCWSRSSPRSRAARPRGMSATPAHCSPSLRHQIRPPRRA